MWQWWKDRWTWLGDSKEQLTVVFTIIAACYVLYEYHASQTDANIKRTMDFQARYSEKELLRARVALDNVFFDKNFEKMRADTGLKGNDAVSAIITDLKLDSNVRLLADFYGQIATCMKNSLCDVDTACSAFHQGAKELRNNFYGLFKEWQKKWRTNLMEPTYEYFEGECATQPDGLWAKIDWWFR
jgi:hypothetical protein